MSLNVDAELKALEQVNDALMSVDFPARQRILEWAERRLCDDRQKNADSKKKVK